MSSFLRDPNWFTLSEETSPRKRRRRAVSEPMPMDVDGEEGSQSRCSVCNGNHFSNLEVPCSESDIRTLDTKDVISRLHPDTSPICFYHRGKPYFECANAPPLMLARNLIAFVQVHKLLFALGGVRQKDLLHGRTSCVMRSGHVVVVTLQSVYQALKFMKTDQALAELIRTQPSARAARREAGFQRAYQRPDWFDVNVEAMDAVLQAKFTQHDDLREKLLETGNRELIEDSPVRRSVLF